VGKNREKEGRKSIFDLTYETVLIIIKTSLRVFKDLMISPEKSKELN